jgi:hypothetical protein
MGKKSSQRNKALAKAQIHQDLREYTQNQASLWLVYQAARKACTARTKTNQASNRAQNTPYQEGRNLEYYLPIPQTQASYQVTYPPQQTLHSRYNFVSFFAIKAANQAAHTQVAPQSY